ncbi:MAG TPA: L-threonylcarbamoyladenylate synthase [Bacteroidota bacterium]|nr:L-threonylcarbamoyladenylate synthase [Bacteroidota bacterium]
MATRITIHPENPQARLVDNVVERLRRGAVMLYPTDTVYAIGCDINSKAGQERIRRIRNLPDDKPLTFVAANISQISDYAKISDSAYQIIRQLVPGPFTFLLPATKMVPNLVLNPRRKTTGIRVPDHFLCQLLIAELGNPLISMSAKLPNWDEPTTNDELFDLFDAHVDMIIEFDAEYRSPDGEHLSTMIDFTGELPVITREGLGIELASQVV